MPPVRQVALGVSMANYRLKAFFMASSQPYIYYLGFFFNTMHTWRLGVTIALLACGLGWSKSAYSCSGHSEFPSAWNLESTNRWVSDDLEITYKSAQGFTTSKTNWSARECGYIFALTCRSHDLTIITPYHLSHSKEDHLRSKPNFAFCFWALLLMISF